MKSTDALYHRNPFVRKGAAAMLQALRRIKRFARTEPALRQNPPVLANSFPKSGTHLLNQLVAALPQRRDYGSFLSSMTSSFRFRERTAAESLRIIESLMPGELMRAHLFYEPQYEQAISGSHAVHYFIYRDPRDVVLSEAHYLRSLNRWHKLHRYFREQQSLEDAIALSIRGMEGQVPGIAYPNIAERFARFAGWLESNRVCVVKFEELVGPQQTSIVSRMAEFYCRSVEENLDQSALAERMLDNINPERSHTYRSGKSGGWQEKFTPRLREQFDTIAGELLIQLGYEADHRWVEANRDSSESVIVQK